MAAKFFTGLPLDGPDPECVLGHGEALLAKRAVTTPPKSRQDHSRRRRTPATVITKIPDRACDENPLAGLELPKESS